MDIMLSQIIGNYSVCLTTNTTTTKTKPQLCIIVIWDNNSPVSGRFPLQRGPVLTHWSNAFLAKPADVIVIENTLERAAFI